MLCETLQEVCSSEYNQYEAGIVPEHKCLYTFIYSAAYLIKAQIIIYCVNITVMR